MKILGIDTSCDETSAAVLEDRRVLSSVVYSQTLAHENWGGVVPSIAKRAHTERIDGVIEKAMQKAKVNLGSLDGIAVTQGPGLAIALEVGLAKAKELAAAAEKPLIAVNHMEGHIYSNFVQNGAGNPKRVYKFPYLVLLVSGGHTELVIFKDHLDYEVIGRTVDDAAGEALDKAARMLGFGYPGGEVLERLAAEIQNDDKYKLPNFSFSGLKTAFLYKTREMANDEKLKELKYLASSFQESVFEHLLRKTSMAIKETGIKNILLGGGVSVNRRLRTLFRAKMKTLGGTVEFPPFKYLNFDNAAMIALAGNYKLQKGIVVPSGASIDRIPRWSLPAFVTHKTDMKFMKVRE
jgi:N6-L-threonylcarbamoyladenine synthase